MRDIHFLLLIAVAVIAWMALADRILIALLRKGE